MTKALFKCRRCGNCCRKGGPALHAEDLRLILDERAIGLEDLVTYRLHEAVYDQPSEQVILLDKEMVKIRPIADGKPCVFYNHKGRECGIYESHPLECRELECTDTDKIEAIYNVGRINRRHIIKKDHPLRELMDGHDEHCAIGTVHELAQELDSAEELEDKARVWTKLSAILEYDENMRKMVQERLELSPEALGFLFGRPVESIFLELGIKTLMNEDGSRRFVILK
ncbi:MAG: YkgJ family cysteine cluster protein [Desulfovibrio sp.]